MPQIPAFTHSIIDTSPPLAKIQGSRITPPTQCNYSVKRRTHSRFKVTPIREYGNDTKNILTIVTKFTVLLLLLLL